VFPNQFEEFAMKMMKWMAIGDGDKVLHINTGSRFKPYNHFPDLMEPDTRMGDMKLSKGFRTAQVLLGRGFVYEESDPEPSDRLFDRSCLVETYGCSIGDLDEGGEAIG
jgi:hypothetical protein